MKSIVIAEKPSVGRDIAKVLHCNKKGNGYMEGSKYVVTWAMGHLVSLADPENYGKEYKEWKLETLPIMPNPWKFEVLKQTGKQFQIVKTQLLRKDINEVIIATDAGREGELVARLILKRVGNKKPIKRLWISSVTDKAILEGFSHLKNGHDYDTLYDAAISRAEADWLVGINATRALTCKYNAQLSCGRVQTPTLAMIAKREEEIKQFVPKEYYGIVMKMSHLTFTWKDKKSQTNSCFQKEKIDEILNKVKGKDGILTELSKTAKKTMSPLLYDLTELQREANRRFNFSAKETLNIMQRLYENYKVLTYPRTDSRYLTQDLEDTLKERLRAVSIGPYKKMTSKLLKQPVLGNKNFINDAKVSDHHAIIPTEQYVPLEDLSSDERKIYDLVVRRFLAVMYPTYEYEEMKVVVKVENEEFVLKENYVIKRGWKEVYEGDEEEKNILQLKEGMKFSNLTFTMTSGKTTPPAYFNEATLLSAMENPIHYMNTEDAQAKRTLGEAGGLGTVATRADIIEKLFQNGLLEKTGKDIKITSKGKQLLSFVPTDLKQPELTADWEMKLARIAKGKMNKEQFMNEIKSYTKELLEKIKTSEGKFHYDNITNKICPNCGKRLLLVNGKNNKKLVCQDRQCGYKETIARLTNARCPVCHKKMELIGKDEKQTFICSCGHKERLTAFEERRKKEGGGVSKKDVKKYMEQQKKEAKEPVNTGMLNALANIKID